jgi:sugar transferase EpsL
VGTWLKLPHFLTLSSIYKKLFISPRFKPMYQKFGKRLLDLSLTLLAMILLTPILAVIAFLIYFKLGSPIFFRQQRPGKYGQPFTILKFRTMRNAVDFQGRPLPDSERLSSLGNFLRWTSLDEFPELYNILKGEMSLVGPRPLLMKYLSRYSPEQMRRQDIKPGLTGWAQINGRNALTWEEKLQFDVWYVDHQSFVLDLKIILLTFWKVFKQEGISHADHATMTEFKGSAINGMVVLAYAGSPYEANRSGQKVDAAQTAHAIVYTPEFKAQAVLDVISGVRTASEVCREYNLKPYLLARWEAEFLENAAAAFHNHEQPSQKSNHANDHLADAGVSNQS